MQGFLSSASASTPAVKFLSPKGMTVDNGENGDFDVFEARLAEARRNRSCAWCGGPLSYRLRVTATFCSPRCGSRFRERRRYAKDPERERARVRPYYAAHREDVLDRAAAKRGRLRPPERTECSECGVPLEGRQRVTCGRAGCRDARFRMLHPEAYAAREARKVERRRERRAAGSAT